MSGHGCNTLSVLGAAPSMGSLGSARYTTLRCALNRSPIDASAPVVELVLIQLHLKPTRTSKTRRLACLLVIGSTFVLTGLEAAHNIKPACNTSTIGFLRRPRYPFSP